MALDLSAVATQLLGSLASNADGHIKIIRTTGEVDSITGDYTEEDGPSEYRLIGAVTQISDTLVDNSRIQAGDVMVTVDNAIEPLMTDKLEIAGLEYKIVAPIKTINHAGVVQVYKMQARK